MGGAGGRRLSWARVGVAVTVTAAAGWVTVDRVATALADDDGASPEVADPWFAPYVDVTLEPATAFEDPAKAPVDDLVLAFVVADGERCRPAWGGAYDLDEAGDALALDRRIARVRQQEGDVIVSFGGAANAELATVCEEVDDLTEAYRSVVERYDLTAVDLDVEGAALADEAAATRRAEALARLQAERREDDRPLEVWLTLPVAPDGLTEGAVAVVDATLAGGVDLAGVNVMTMDFGESRSDGQSVLDASLAALDATHEQLAAAYRRAGVTLTDTEVWARIGATPMLGQNDTPDDRFELDDARRLVETAQERGLGRLSVWSLNRDLPCGPNDTGTASPHCSGTTEDAGAFTAAFAVLDGRPGEELRDALTAPTGRDGLAEDDPATSPYAIWDDLEAYAEGDRVVWHHNVYAAKWWNQDSAPDLPVENAWDTPWRLLGPVLPGEHPVEPEPLPEGTHPEWEPDAVYHAGDVVQLDGVGYRARWWTSGEPPDADTRDPFASPWAVLPLD